MKKDSANDAAGVAVSSGQSAAGTALETTAQAGAPAESEKVADVGLTEYQRQELSLRLQKALHAIEHGFDSLTAPGDIFKMDRPFFVVDGIIIDDFVDKKTGEVKSKCVFVLEFEDGIVVNTMQSAARPRRLVAEACENARLLGGRYRNGPLKYTRKGVGQIQDAYIFEKQPGWTQTVSG